MTIDEQRIIAYLDERYPTALSRRALWSWAGGAAAETDYAEVGWAAMFATAQRGETASQLTLVRELLFDNPGDRFLLDYAGQLAVESSDTAAQIGRLFVAAFEQMAPEFSFDLMSAILLTYPEAHRECAFVALVPNLQSLFSPESREHLDEGFGEISTGEDWIHPRALFAGMDFLLSGGETCVDCAAIDGFPEAAEAVHGLLRSLYGPEAAEQEEDDAEMSEDDDEIPELPEAEVTSLRARLEPHLAALEAAAAETELLAFVLDAIRVQEAALESLLKSRPVAPPRAAARAFRQALWATTAAASTEEAGR